MSDMQDARDPYVGMQRFFLRQAGSCVPSWLIIGKVLSVAPLKIRADGMDLDADDLRVAQHLTAREHPTVAELPQKQFAGTCEITIGEDTYTGSARVTRPRETVTGRPTAQRAGALPGVLLSAGDEVLLMPSQDAQTYYVIERMVTP